MGARGRAHPSFAMTPTFREYDLWSQKTQILKSRCHTTRAHPSFGMTTTKTLRSVFSWRASHVNQNVINIINVFQYWKMVALEMDKQTVIARSTCTDVDYHVDHVLSNEACESHNYIIFSHWSCFIIELKNPLRKCHCHSLVNLYSNWISCIKLKWSWVSNM